METRKKTRQFFFSPKLCFYFLGNFGDSTAECSEFVVKKHKTMVELQETTAIADSESGEFPQIYRNVT